MDIAERLVAADPDNTGFQCDLAVARRRRCLGGTVTGGPRVTVYSPPMTGNRPELPGSHRGFEMVNPVVAQWETGNNSDCQDLRIANPLLAGSSPARPTMVFQSVRLPCPICPGALSHKRPHTRASRISRSFPVLARVAVRSTAILHALAGDGECCLTDPRLGRSQCVDSSPSQSRLKPQMWVVHLVAGVLGELDLDSVRVPPEHLLAGADELACQLGSRISRPALAHMAHQ